MDQDNRPSLRLFYALWPDEPVRDALTGLQSNLQGRLTRRANLHLTLAFLGSQPASLVPTLIDVLHQLPAPDMLLTLDRFGYFSRPRVAWAGLREVPAALTSLHAALNAALAQHDIVFERQAAFKPHVTLARNAAPPPDTSFEPIAWHPRQVALVESVSEDGGVSYRVLASR
jgi:2'-5' RNA ligase